MPRETVYSEAFVRELQRALTWVAAAVGGVLLLALILYRAEILFLIFGGVLLAIFLDTLTDLLRKRTKLSRLWALGAVIAGLVLLLGSIGWLLAGNIASQFSELLRAIPEGDILLRDFLEGQRWARPLLPHLPEDPLLSTEPEAVRNQVATVFLTSLEVISYLVVIVFVGVYAAVAPAFYRDGLLIVVPPENRDRAEETLQQVYGHLRGWLLGRLFSMFVVGVGTGLGLWLLGMPAWFALGVIAFLLDFIPFIGPIIAAIPGVLVAMTFGPNMVAYVVLLYLAVQSLEIFVVIPMVIQYAAFLPPVLLITGQLLAYALAGVLGMLFASPMMITAMVIIKMLYLEDGLGEQIEDVAMHPEEKQQSLPSDRSVD